MYRSADFVLRGNRINGIKPLYITCNSLVYLQMILISFNLQNFFPWFDFIGNRTGLVPTGRWQNHIRGPFPASWNPILKWRHQYINKAAILSLNQHFYFSIDSQSLLDIYISLCIIGQQIAVIIGEGSPLNFGIILQLKRRILSFV